MGLFDFLKPKPEKLPIRGYWTLVKLITDARDDAERLALCEEALPLLPSFVDQRMREDGELPPVVPPRDTLPEMYMRFGKWEDAERVINLCISCGAYGHTEYKNSRDHDGHWVVESGGDVLSSLRLRHAAADGLLKFLHENPGFLQKDVYKTPALSTLDHDALVWVCRSFHLIRKEKSGKTNRLYASIGGEL